MKNQQGFTLIELVVVIVILGILAAVAVPKFIDIQVDARVSTLEGMQGALNSAASLARAQQLVKGLDSGGDITVGADTVGMEYGYPEVAEIIKLVEIEGFDHTGGEFSIPGRSNCNVTYAPNTDGSFPSIEIDSSNCN